MTTEGTVDDPDRAAPGDEALLARLRQALPPADGLLAAVRTALGDHARRAAAAEQRARRAERAAALLQAQVDQAADALLLTTPEGRVEALNAAATRLLRLPAARPGFLLADVAPGASPRLLVGAPRRLEAQRADGEAFVAEASCAEVAHDDERRFVVCLRDTQAAPPPSDPPPSPEALRTLAAEKHQRSAILSATSDGMLLVDPGGVVAYANRRFGELVGLDVDQVDGEAAGALAQRLRERGPTPGQAFDLVLLAADRQREVGPVRCLLGARTLRLSMSPVRRDDAAFLGSLVVVRDVTVEEKVQRAKEELIGNVSHELRTPLTSIRGFVDLLRAGRAGAVTSKQKELLEIVAENVTRLTSLVADLLEVDRVAQAPLAEVRLDLVPLLRDALAVEEASAARKALALELEAPEALEVVGDPDRLRQVFGNLLSNAVKYTARGGVSVVAAPVDAERVRVEVRDTGVGIRPGDIAQLFQRFFRADDPAVRAAGGTGLGLSIVKTLVERQQGAVEVESEPGRGSCFRVLLRAGRSRAERPSSTTLPRHVERLTDSTPPPADWPRLLAVDADPERQRLYQATLRAIGVEAVPAPHLARAREVAQGSPPQLLLVATDLPELEAADGWGAARQDAALRKAPLVVVIAPEEIGRALRAGVDGLVTRPVEPAALRAEVERVLALRRAAPEAP
ncbi:MAG: ATP-binding protein [Planctomycetes bacterium]|nr:ATP-binding protein [Planctomycetota bacterium]